MPIGASASGGRGVTTEGEGSKRRRPKINIERKSSLTGDKECLACGETYGFDKRVCPKCQSGDYISLAGAA